MTGTKADRVTVLNMGLGYAYCTPTAFGQQKQSPSKMKPHAYIALVRLKLIAKTFPSELATVVTDRGSRAELD